MGLSPSALDKVLIRRMPGFPLRHDRIRAASPPAQDAIRPLSSTWDRGSTLLSTIKPGYPDNSMLEFPATFHHSGPTELPIVR